MHLAEELRALVKGDVLDDEATLATHSHDASMFEVRPTVVVYPRDARDVEAVVSFVASHKKKSPELSVTARAAGTDMSGGPLNESIILSFGKYFTHVGSVADSAITSQPGVFYRDFEKETLKQGMIMPSYPASRELCAIGGIVNNNSGGEKTLAYGKTERYVTALKVVFADGVEREVRPLTEAELKKKVRQKNFEGEVYRKLSALITKNAKAITAARPQVSKNSAGYALWNVWDAERKVFDVTKLFVGAQGTLGMVTEATFRLVPVKQHSRMVVIFLRDLGPLVDVVQAVLPFKPESFESYDDHTLSLALKFFPAFAKQLGAKNLISIGLKFLPEFWMVVTRGVPKLVLQAEFAGDDEEALERRTREVAAALAQFPVAVRTTHSEADSKKYWVIRRESFNLLRQRIKGRHTAPYIDDIVVPPEKLGDFLPQLSAIFNEYPKLIYTIAGHVGDGNFHIIPLVNFRDQSERAMIPEISDRVYDLVIQHGGSITGEHNDGLIRTPYLEKMYGTRITKLFEQVKKIFDPQGIFNPRKKVGADLPYAIAHMIRE